MKHFFQVLLVWVVILLNISCSDELSIASTVADLQVVHEGVLLNNKEQLQVHRVLEGATVETKPEGRARLRLDDGSVVLVDGDTKIIVSSEQLALEWGRLFVQGATGARTTVDLGEAVATIPGGHAGIERSKDVSKKSSVYAASGELIVRASEKDHRVSTGESARIEGGGVQVVPERAFDDWTGGMAAPWSAVGQPRRVVGALWGSPAGDPGSPLTLRSQDVSVQVVGESALTRVTTTFFHAGKEVVQGDFRMALPQGALITGFAIGTGDQLREATVGMADREGNVSATDTTLEWAGDGWVRGSFPSIAPGTLVQVQVRYAEWLRRRLTDKGFSVEYRFPLASEADPPIIGEFLAKVSTLSEPTSIRSGHGSTVSENNVILRKSDFRPTADFVVEFEYPKEKSPARLYVAGADPDDESGSYVLVRTEAPSTHATKGVRLAVVLDSSASMTGDFDAARGWLESLVRALGGSDEMVVLTADSTVRPLGPASIGGLDKQRKNAIVEALGKLEPGGATDLGLALEAAADKLDPKHPSGMVVYVGDGWPTLGDLQTNEIRARLSRRAGGSPRLAAVAVGTRSNRFGLTALVRGLGPFLVVQDKTDGSEAAHALLADALQPTIGSARIDLGPDVEQVYPLHAQAVVAGATIFAVGRTRGEAPRQVTLRWLGEKGEEERKLVAGVERLADATDIRRRWAMARVEELALRSRGREAVTYVALRERLLTPWTGWTLNVGSPALYRETPVMERVLDVGAIDSAPFSVELATPRTIGAVALDLSQEGNSFSWQGERGFEEAIRMAARRTLDEAVGGIRACRDSRAALRPDLTGVLEVTWKVDGNGKASDVEVKGSSSAYDPALFRCVELVVEGLSFPDSGSTTKVSVVHTIQLPPGRPAGRTKCSSTSTLPMPARRGVWEQRLTTGNPLNIYITAKQQCELRDWASRRAMLELVMLRVLGDQRVSLARQLEVAGEKDASDFLRREAMRRARSPEEVKEVRRALLADEGYPVDVFERRYRAANSDSARLAVVRTFLGFAPHDIRLRRQLLVLLEALDDKEALRQEVARIRRDPFSDATLLAYAASALKRLGNELESLRTFGEILERAPKDPWARSFVSDRLRKEGWYDAAWQAVAPLERGMPSDQAVLLRLALSHEGAGRIDLAGRILMRLTQTGGRSLDTGLSELASDLASVMLVQPREELSKDKRDELVRRAIELPRPRGTVWLIRTPGGTPPISVMMERGPQQAREERKPDIQAEALGMYRFVQEGETEDIVLQLSAKEDLQPSTPIEVGVDILIPQGPGQPPMLHSRRIQVNKDGQPVSLRWSNGRWN